MYQPTLKTSISTNKEDAYHSAIITHNLTRYKVYCDGSGFKNGTSAEAVLYKGNKHIKTLMLHVGNISEHTVLLDEIHNKVELLHTKQDHMEHKLEFWKAKQLNTPIKAKTRGVE